MENTLLDYVPLLDEIKRDITQSEIEKIIQYLDTEAAFNNDCDGRNEIDKVVMEGHTNKLRLLLEQMSEIGPSTTSTIQSLVYLAAKTGRLECMKLLLAYGGSPIIREESEDGNTAMHIAVLNSHYTMTCWLLEIGVSMNVKNNRGITPFICAVMKGQKDLVQIFLEREGDVNTQIENMGDITPLHIAVEKCHENLLIFLLENGADMSVYCSVSGQTPVHWAAALGNLSCLKIMDKFGANLSVQTKCKDGYRPIHLATINGHTSTVEWFLSKGISGYSINKHGLSALHVAAYCGHNELVNTVLKTNMDVNIRTSNPECTTALHITAFRGNIDLLKLLLNKGADANIEHKTDNFTPMHFATRKDNVECLKTLAEFGGNFTVHIGTDHGEPLIITAAKYDSKDAAKWLLDKGLPINIKDKEGLTSIHHAAMNNSCKVASLLYSRGADINIKAENRFRMSPIHYAVVLGHTDTTKLLLDWGADWRAETDDKLNSLHFAAMAGELGCFEEIVLRGGNIFTPTGNDVGELPIHIAASFGHEKIVEWLLDKGESVNKFSKSGITPLLKSVKEGHRNLVQILLNRGADVNLGNPQNATPLHVASICGHLELVHVLIDTGAVVNSLTNEERSPLHLAAASGYQQIVKILVRCGAFIAARDSEGLTAEKLADLAGHEEIKLFLQNESKVEYISMDSYLLNYKGILL